jgi:hypothetical protein
LVDKDEVVADGSQNPRLKSNAEGDHRSHSSIRACAMREESRVAFSQTLLGKPFIQPKRGVVPAANRAASNGAVEMKPIKKI